MGATPINVRFAPAELAVLDAWIAAQGEPLSRPEAVRRILAGKFASHSTAQIEEAIVEHWGARCPDSEPGCPICDAWAEFDALG